MIFKHISQSCNLTFIIFLKLIIQKLVLNLKKPKILFQLANYHIIISTSVFCLNVHVILVYFLVLDIGI